MPMYLHLPKHMFPYRYSRIDGDYIHFPEVYQMDSEWESLDRQWRQATSSIDGLISGIYADWLEENRSELVPVRGTGEQLPKLIDWLRNRFNDPDHNQTADSTPEAVAVLNRFIELRRQFQ